MGWLLKKQRKVSAMVMAGNLSSLALQSKEIKKPKMAFGD